MPLCTPSSLLIQANPAISFCRFIALLLNWVWKVFRKNKTWWSPSGQLCSHVMLPAYQESLYQYQFWVTNRQCAYALCIYTAIGAKLKTQRNTSARRKLKNCKQKSKNMHGMRKIAYAPQPCKNHNAICNFFAPSPCHSSERAADFYMHHEEIGAFFN